MAVNRLRRTATTLPRKLVSSNFTYVETESPRGPVPRPRSHGWQRISGIQAQTIWLQKSDLSASVAQEKKSSTFHYMFIESDVKVVLQEKTFCSRKYIVLHSEIYQERVHPNYVSVFG